MELLAHINPEDIQESDTKDYESRVAARAVVFDSDNKVALLKVNKHNYHKLPGGGVEDSEDVKQALEREIEEEVGCDIDITGELGRVTEYRGENKFKQESFSFIAEVVGEKGEPKFTPREIEDQFEVVWLDIDEAIDVIKKNTEVTNYGGQFMTKRELFILEKAKEVSGK